MIITATKYKKLTDNELKKSLAKVQRKFNKFICLRDLRLDENNNVYGIDISTGKRWDAVLYSDRSIMNGKKWHASHYWNEEKYSSVRFDERNVNGQFAFLNRYHGGDKSNYEIGLRKKIGDLEFENLEIKKNQIKKWNVIELEEMYKIYSAKVKEEAKRLKIRV